MGNRCFFVVAAFIFDLIFSILAGNKDNHKILDDQFPPHTEELVALRVWKNLQLIIGEML